jgi:hypothetical protein
MELINEVFDVLMNAVTSVPLAAFLVILGVSCRFALLTYILIKINDKRATNMKLSLGDQVTYHMTDRPGKVIEDKGDTIRIEIEIPRHLVSKVK